MDCRSPAIVVFALAASCRGGGGIEVPRDGSGSEHPDLPDSGAFATESPRESGSQVLDGRIGAEDSAGGGVGGGGSGGSDAGGQGGTGGLGGMDGGAGAPMTSGTVACGRLLNCDLTTHACCLEPGTAARCQPVGAGCAGAFVGCDEKADCPRGRSGDRPGWTLTPIFAVPASGQVCKGSGE